jgi:hypothetical protein
MDSGKRRLMAVGVEAVEPSDDVVLRQVMLDLRTAVIELSDASPWVSTLGSLEATLEVYLRQRDRQERRP